MVSNPRDAIFGNAMRSKGFDAGANCGLFDTGLAGNDGTNTIPFGGGSGGGFVGAAGTSTGRDTIVACDAMVGCDALVGCGAFAGTAGGALFGGFCASCTILEYSYAA